MIRTGDLKISVFEFIVMIIVLYNQIMYIPQSSKYKSVVVELSASLSFMIFCNGVLSCINGTEFFGSYYINYVFTVIYFILNGLVPLLWFKYMYIFYDTSPKKSNSYITTIPYLLYLLLIFINCFTDLFFYIDSNNRYQRGDGFWLIVVLSVIYIIASVVVIVLAITRNRGFRSEGKHILSGMLLVALGIILQLYFWEDSFVLLTFLLFMLIVFLRFQNLEMLVDPLTGLGNRRRMQLYIDKLSRKRKGEFSAIVFDIDDFKDINDLYSIFISLLTVNSETPILISTFLGNTFLLLNSFNNSLNLAINPSTSSFGVITINSSPPYLIQVIFLFPADFSNIFEIMTKILSP